MAYTAYSKWTSYSRRTNAYLEVSSSSADASVTYTLKGYANTGDGNGYEQAAQYTAKVELFYKVGSGSWVSLGSTTGTLSYAAYVGSITKSVTIKRTSAAQSVAFACDVTSPGSLWPTASAQGTDTVAKLPTYTVSYNGNGSTGGSTSSQTKTHGTALALRANGFTRSGTSSSVKVTLDGNGGTPASASVSATRATSYSFSKWNTKADGSGTSYAAGASYTQNAAATLYAQWASSSSVTAATLPGATRANHSFLGWYTAATGGTRVGGEGTAYAPSSAVTLHAQWEQTYSPPAMSSATVWRSSGTSAVADEGTRAWLKVSWSADQSSGANHGKALAVSWSSTDGSSTGSTSIDLGSDKTSGSVAQAIGSDGAFDTTKSYVVALSLTDTKGGSTPRALTLTQAFFTLDLLAGGHGVAIGKPATTEGLLDVGMDMRIDGELSPNGGVVLPARNVSYIAGAKGSVAIFAPKLDTGANQWSPVLAIQTKGGGVWTFGNYDGDHFRMVYHSKATIDAGTNSPDRMVSFNADGTTSGLSVTTSQVTNLLPTVLYNNTTGTNGDVTLSQTAANFTRLRVFANLQNAGYCSCDVWSPNGKTFSVTGMALPQTTTVQQAWWSGSISGTKITKKSSGYVNTTTHSSGNHTGAAATSTDMRIVRVEGYKW